MRCLQAVVVLAGVATGALRPLRSRALRQPSPRRKAHVSRTALAVPRGGALEPIELAGHVAVGFWSFGSTIAAGRAQMDCVGCLVIAFLGTLGGSTMRDLMLSRRVFWVADPSYLATLGVTSLLTFALYPWIAHKAGFGGTKRTAVQLLLELPDATVKQRNFTQRAELWHGLQLRSLAGGRGPLTHSLHSNSTPLHSTPLHSTPLHCSTTPRVCIRSIQGWWRN